MENMEPYISNLDITDYAIEGIPRFIFLYPDGDIVSTDVMRPSNPELIILLDELIQRD
tara:strand:- start:259 stop:432 length:174 start_codon:yes stop_codon:yes gene_type:complete